jgi:cytochrome oxidase Cu insertion factor (SCO1/SenC/PrrC family)
MNRNNFILAILGITLLVLVYLLIKFTETESKPLSFLGSGEMVKEAQDNPKIGGEFNLINQYGEHIDSKTFTGKLMLVYFGFSYCPDICPTSLQFIGDILENLSESEKEQVIPIFITIDPHRDTPEKLKTYLSYFNPKIIGLTGTEDQIKAVAAEYKIYYDKPANQSDKNYLMDHSSLIYLMDKNGRYATHFSTETNIKKITDNIKKLL